MFRNVHQENCASHGYMQCDCPWHELVAVGHGMRSFGGNGKQLSARGSLHKWSHANHGSD